MRRKVNRSAPIIVSARRSADADTGRGRERRLPQFRRARIRDLSVLSVTSLAIRAANIACQWIRMEKETDVEASRQRVNTPPHTNT